LQHHSIKTTNKTIMKTKISLAMAILFAAGSLTFSSCRKKEEKPDPEPEPDTEQSTANDNNLAESFVSDIGAMGSQVTDEGTLATYRPSGTSGVTGVVAVAPCATVTGLGTQIITVDFGSTGCVGQDGRTRTGKLIYNFSASSPSTSVYYRNPGFSMNVSSQNYVVDSYSVNITNHTVWNTTSSSLPSGPMPGTNLTWSVNANVSIVKPNNNGSISWSCNRTKELVNTNDSTCYKGQSQHIVWTKAIVKINGSSSGVNARGENFTATSTNLVRDFNCAPDPLHPHRHPFISGTISYTPGTRPTRLINFGSSTCDLLATVTINGNTYNITLP
jgi:hypothetical protein